MSIIEPHAETHRNNRAGPPEAGCGAPGAERPFHHPDRCIVSRTAGTATGRYAARTAHTARRLDLPPVPFGGVLVTSPRASGGPSQTHCRGLLAHNTRHNVTRETGDGVGPALCSRCSVLASDMKSTAQTRLPETHFILIRCEVKGQGCRICTDCKAL